MRDQLTNFTRRWIVAGSWVYFTVLFTWCVFYFTTGDRISFIALLNNLAVYLFLPLPPVILLGVSMRRPEVWFGSGLGVAVFFALWGPLFSPRSVVEDSNQSTLRVLTYNVLGNHDQIQPLIDVIREEDPEVAFIQELNHVLAAALKVDLLSDYPYQFLDPVNGVAGMGVISKHPLRQADEELPLDWVGEPQVLEMDWRGKWVTLVNFHMYPSGLGPPGSVALVYRLREDQARALAEFSRDAADRGPLIVAGDANVTSLSDAYKIVRTSLKDVWWEQGSGLGHTFPGSDIAGSARPRIAGWPVPRWLARIDYIFHSSHWHTKAAWLAPFDGVSDHRGVLAELVLVSLD